MMPLELGGEVLGYLSADFSSKLRPYSDVFDFSPGPPESPVRVRLVASLETATLQQRTAAVGKVCAQLREQGHIYGWRDELLPVLTGYTDPPRLLVERAACPYFGTKAYGVHVNGYVRTGGYISHLWVATRSATKSTWPGMLDHIVAGGQPHGISIMGNVIKECAEEASIPADLAAQALPTGAVSYNYFDDNGSLKRDALFCFDLSLPRDFVPVPMDGEVEKFELREVGWVLDRVVEGGAGGYKPNCNLVLIDFFLRNGIIDPESKGYLELLAGLRGSGCS
ncbi:hypothetical protein B484DRAFT_413299 [Ochromonadaceae sp. CCMP2298]|nr:hypothetical protein B484DRAFT_413299 [Ochromonadaceae sp. CCMP2298]